MRENIAIGIVIGLVFALGLIFGILICDLGAC